MTRHYSDVRKILVIDDNQDVRSLFLETLEPQGFEVVTSSDPEEGVEKARNAVPDLIFISILFPASNGLKVSKAINADERLKNVPIVMLITYEGELDPKYTATIGIVDVLVKPLSSREVLSKTLSLLGEDDILPTIEADAPGISAGSETEIYPLDEAFAGAGQVRAEMPREEDPWDREIFDLKNEEAFSGAGAGSRKGPSGPPEVPERIDDFLDYETEDFAREEGAIPSGKKNDDATGKEPEEADLKREEGVRQDKDFSYEDEEMADGRAKSLSKRIILVLAAIVIVGGAGIGAYSLMHFMSGNDPKQIKKELAGQGRPSGVAKPREAAPAPDVQPEKRPAPASPETKTENPSAVDQQKGKSERAEAVAPGRGQPAKPGEKTEAPSADRSEAAAGKAAVTPLRKTEPGVQKARTAATYSVQVGFFKDEKNASALVARLKQKGYDAYLRAEGGEKGKRVLVGKFSDRKEAFAQAHLLLKNDDLKAIVYRY